MYKIHTMPLILKFLCKHLFVYFYSYKLNSVLYKLHNKNIKHTETAMISVD